MAALIGIGKIGEVDPHKRRVRLSPEPFAFELASAPTVTNATPRVGAAVWKIAQTGART
jgi:hypothetical protein